MISILLNRQRTAIGLNADVVAVGGGGNYEHETNVKGRDFVRILFKKEYDYPCHSPREVSISK